MKFTSFQLAAMLVAGLPVVALAQSVPATSARVLASNCFQCHGTNGRSVGGIDRLAGMSASELIGEMREMRAETPGNNIMKVHARGYTDAQLTEIAAFFANQPR
jgi:sulfide dehydrogenase cytochrome subunit